MKWAISSLSWPTRPAVPPLTTGAQQRAVLCDRRMTPSTQVWLPASKVSSGA